MEGGGIAEELCGSGGLTDRLFWGDTIHLGIIPVFKFTQEHDATVSVIQRNLP